mgnify:FL=1
MTLPAFADLLERLVFSPGRHAKLALLGQWFAGQPDPERGLGLAAITESLKLGTAKPAMLREITMARVDAELFRLSYDYVGDLAETIALIWPKRAGVNAPPPRLSDIITTLETSSKAEIPALIAGWLDTLDASGRLALIKLLTGGLRVGVSARLARVALAEWSGEAVEAIEEAWHAIAPPYEPLFAWLEGKAARPDPKSTPIFRPLMLAHPLEEADLAALDPSAYRAEWKWDGIRVQLSAGLGGQRLWSRGAEDISASFPEMMNGLDFHAVLDGELLVLRDGEVAPFADLQQRLNRKSVTAKMQRDYPVGIRLYDMLFEGDEDLRPLPFSVRRARLEAWYQRQQPPRMDLSGIITFSEIAELQGLREGARDAAIEGLMLKRADGPYLPGRVKGQWWKWKRAPLTLDAVLMYAQRGHGKRSSFYSDYTFGVWREDGELVPIGKAYSGYTDEELAWLDRWIRNNTVDRFGPVREVEKALVLEVAFDAAQRSTRHKSGVALRFPRIARIRRDKPAEEADRLETALALIGQD